jgi:DNA polymerase-4
MDAFYASVEVLDDPSLAGRPVIVGGTGDRGVVSAASYEAREYGVHSAQPTFTARRLCPHGLFLPVRMSRYQQMSARIFDIFKRFTPLVEPLSLDEAFLDVTGTERLFGPPADLADRIKRLVKTETGLTVSAGVAPTKMAAKIASDLEKPDGLTVVPPSEVGPFLGRLPIPKLWGVGRATRKTLQMLGVETIGDLARMDIDFMERKLGSSGRQLVLLARGEDDRAVSPSRTVKSIGAEDTFGQDVTDVEKASAELLRLTVRASRRLRAKGFLCRTVTLKVKYSDFKQITRAESLARPTDEIKVIHTALKNLLPQTAVGRRPVRLLGVSLSGLTVENESGQYSWLDGMAESSRGRDLDRALDRIAEKYGDRAVVAATLLKE